MIISDLQYIETVNTSEVQGGNHRRRNRNEASATAYADAFGNNTYTSTYSDAFVVEGELSSSTSGSYARASS